MWIVTNLQKYALLLHILLQTCQENIYYFYKDISLSKSSSNPFSIPFFSPVRFLVIPSCWWVSRLTPNWVSLFLEIHVVIWSIVNMSGNAIYDGYSFWGAVWSRTFPHILHIMGHCCIWVTFHPWGQSFSPGCDSSKGSHVCSKCNENRGILKSILQNHTIEVFLHTFS